MSVASFSFVHAHTYSKKETKRVIQAETDGNGFCLLGKEPNANLEHMVLGIRKTP